MSVASERGQPARPLRARAKLRPKSQLTLPEEIRQALHVSIGDELEFAVQDDGTVTVRGYVSVPSDELWRYVPRPDEQTGPDE
jgi:bifunctional DNA-binding transcriptional regulator/antitoxin component of YhaV-PrlF toxin-antitoxin module